MRWICSDWNQLGPSIVTATFINHPIMFRVDKCNVKTFQWFHAKRLYLHLLQDLVTTVLCSVSLCFVAPFHVIIMPIYDVLSDWLFGVLLHFQQFSVISQRFLCNFLVWSDLNPFPHTDALWRLFSRQLIKTLWQKGKIDHKEQFISQFATMF